VSAAAARGEAARAFFEAEAERIARLCHALAERFAAGGRLIAAGETPSARSDARHVAVEFVHLTNTGESFVGEPILYSPGSTVTGFLGSVYIVSRMCSSGSIA
jgi:D-sedoheptulose 7-phosphate isomerase